MSVNLQSIYDRLNQATEFTPLSAETFGDWGLEAGDIVSVSKDGKTYSTPVMQSTLKWNGASMVTIESTGSEEREPVVIQSQRKYDGRGGSYYNNQYTQHRITETEEQLRVEYWTANSALYTYIDVTATGIRTDIANAESGLYGHIQATADELNVNYAKANSQIYTDIKITAEGIRTDMANAESGLYGHIQATADRLEVAYSEANSAIYTKIDVTAEGIRTDMANADSGLYGHIQATADELNVNYAKANSQIYTDIKITAEGIRTDMANADSGLYGHIQATANALDVKYSAANSTLYTHVSQTATDIYTFVANTDSSLATKIAQTDSAVGVSVGRIVRPQVRDYAYRSMFPSTGNANRVYLDSSTGQYYIWDATAEQYRRASYDSATEIASYVKAGEIALSINEDGSTEARIDATRIWLGSLSDEEKQDLAGFAADAENKSGVFAKYLTVRRLSAQEITTMLAEIGTATIDSIYANQMGVKSGGVFSAPTMIITGATEASSIDVKTALQSNISAVRVNGPTNNTYTLQYQKYGDDKWYDADPGTFSRAISSWSGAWSGGVYTVTANPQDQSRTIGFSSSADMPLQLAAGEGATSAASLIKTRLTAPIVVQEIQTGQGDDDSYVTRFTQNVTVDGTPVYNNGWAAAQSKVALPGVNTTTGSFSVFTPPATVDGTASEETFTINTSMNNVSYVQNSAGTIVARVEHNKYNAGWAAAQSKVANAAEIASGVESTEFSVTVPSATVGDSETKDFTLTKGATPASTGYATVARSDNKVVARIDIGDWYTAGQNNILNNLSASAYLSWNSTTHTYTAQGTASVSGTVKDSDTDTSDELTLNINALQGSGSTAYRTVTLKEGSVIRFSSENITDYGDGYTAGQLVAQTAAGVSLNVDSKSIEFSTSSSVKSYSVGFNNGAWSNGVKTVSVTATAAGSSSNSTLYTATTRVDMPKATPTTMSQYLVIGLYNNASDGSAAESATYSVSADNNYAYINWGSVPVAQVYHGRYSAGQQSATVGGSWDGTTGRFTANNAYNQSNQYYTELADVANSDITWNGNTASVAISAYNNGGKMKVSTGKTITVDASGRYNAGWAASISSLTITVPTTKTLDYDETVTVTVKAKKANGNEEYLAAATYTAKADRYNAGWANAISSITWINENTNSETMSVTYKQSAGAADSSQSYRITTGTWSNGSLPVYIKSGASGGTTVAQSSVSAPTMTLTPTAYAQNENQFSVNATHGTASKGSCYVYLTLDESAKKVYARKDGLTGDVVGGQDCSTVYNNGKADADVGGGWSNGTYKAYNTSNSTNKKVETTLQGLSASGNVAQCTADGTASTTGKCVKRNFNVLYVGTDGVTGVSTGLDAQTVILDASSVYDYGVTEGASSVTLSGPTWNTSNHRFTVTASNGESKSGTIYLAGSTYATDLSTFTRRGRIHACHTSATYTNSVRHTNLFMAEDVDNQKVTLSYGDSESSSVKIAEISTAETYNAGADSVTPESHTANITLTRTQAGITSSGAKTKGILYQYNENTGTYVALTTGEHYWYYADRDLGTSKKVYY